MPRLPSLHCLIFIRRMSGRTQAPFTSRRSPSLGLNGCASTDQPLASQAALDILRRGGNAADAAVAAAAALQVLEPMATGLGGDCFCLFYEASTKRVHALNGSGKTSSRLTLDVVRSRGYDEDNKFPPNSGLSVTVPGACRGWYDTLRYFGSKKVSMADILKPAISLAEQGFPVEPMLALYWSTMTEKLESISNGDEFLVGGYSPPAGYVFKNPRLARTLKRVAFEGPSAIYTGQIAKSIVDAVKEAGGVMTLEDLLDHMESTEPVLMEPINVDYRGASVWTMPPNSQGVVLLEALNILKGFSLKNLDRGSADYHHLLIEALRMSFTDALQVVGDYRSAREKLFTLLKEQLANNRRSLISHERCLDMKDVKISAPEQSGTVFISVVDKDGNACSFINSNFRGFGCTVPANCGFALHCRGMGFSLEESHPNCIGPKKHPYHTLMPVLVTDTSSGELLASIGCMGGYGQPMFVLQVLLNMIEFGMNPQEAVDQPRFLIGSGYTLCPDDPLQVEEDMPEAVVEGLRQKGHVIESIVSGASRRDFGYCHLITRGDWWRYWNGRLDICTSKAYWGGSDPRSDGVPLVL